MMRRRRWVVRPRDVDDEVSSPNAAVVVTVTPDGSVSIVTPHGPVRFSRTDVRRLVVAVRTAQAAAIWQHGWSGELG